MEAIRWKNVDLSSVSPIEAEVILRLMIAQEMTLALQKFARISLAIILPLMLAQAICVEMGW